MHHSKRRPNRRGYAVRAVTLLAAAVTAATTAGTVYASTGPDLDPIPAAPSAAAAAPGAHGAPGAAGAPTVPASPTAPTLPPARAAKPGFFETYRGHHIMGWGENEKACAYIDGVQLVLYPTGDGKYSSNLQGFQQEASVRAITKASVKTLGKLKMTTPDDGAAHCPTFVVRTPSKAASTKAPTASPTPSASPTRPASTTHSAPVAHSTPAHSAAAHSAAATRP